MKETNETLPATTTTTTTTGDYVTCNGHQDNPSEVHKEAVNDDARSMSLANLPSSELAVLPAGNPNELVILPELAFTIRVQSTGNETFDLPVTSSELVQEIHQVLMDKEETCHRTCFSLQLEGTILDNFTELKNIDNLREGSLLKVVEGLSRSDVSTSSLERFLFIFRTIHDTGSSYPCETY